MDFCDSLLDESHLTWREVCRRFAEQEILPQAVEWEEAEIFPRTLYEAAGSVGIIGAGFPEEVGGSGGDALHVVMGIEGLLRGGSTGVAVGLGSAGIALPPILQAESAELNEELVRPMLRGQKIGALAVTEPGTGSDVAGICTRATRDGDAYVVQGRKQFITSGTRADVLTTLVRTGEDRYGGLSFLAIPTTLEGVEVSRSLKKTGWRASDTAEIGFESVRVPARYLLGKEGSAFATLMRNFEGERLALAAYGAATAQIALEEANRYAGEREAFGRPLGGFQVTRHKLAHMATRVVAARTFVYQVARQMNEGRSVIAEIAMAKNFCAEVALEVTYEAVQIHGGMGYMRETLVERLSRDARLLPIGGGTREIMHRIIADRLELGRS